MVLAKLCMGYSQTTITNRRLRGNLCGEISMRAATANTGAHRWLHACTRCVCGPNVLHISGDRDKHPNMRINIILWRANVLFDSDSPNYRPDAIAFHTFQWSGLEIVPATVTSQAEVHLGSKLTSSFNILSKPECTLCGGGKIAEKKGWQQMQHVAHRILFAIYAESV